MQWREHIARYSPAHLPGERWMRTTFIVLFLLAALLRFWDLATLPYTHDEMSALIRLYPTLGETITKGVIELDTHPPGVQVFEWLWTRVFTMEEADVKLPFILMDLLALLLLYRFALAWTGAGPALLLTTLMATLQYSVFYGQIARPYAAGLFTTALLADQLTRYLAFGERRQLVGVGIAAVLSAYTHHFALMLAALMVGTGLLLIRRDQRRAYLIMCVAVILLYLPNLPIFFTQLGQGGLTDWLQAPAADWLANYGWYIANNNALLAGLLCFLVLVSVIATVRSIHSASPSRWFLLLWGALPLVVGYAYSVWRAPVLQYSVVLFSFPYLVLFFLQGLARVERKLVLIGCAVVTAVSVHGLVKERKHYELLYKSKYEAMLREGINVVKQHGKDHALVLLDAPDNVLRFYLDLWKMPFEELGYVQLRDSYSEARLDSILAASAGRVVVYGQSNGARPENAAIIQQRFPYLVQRQDLVDGQVFRFSDRPVALRWFDRDTIASLSPNDAAFGQWNISADLPVVIDSTGDRIGWDYNGREYGLAIDIALDSLDLQPGEQLEVIAEVDGWSPGTEAGMVADVRHADSTVFYRGGQLDPRHRPNGRTTMIVAIAPSDIEGDSLLLRTYVYNPSKAPLRVRRIDILRRQANPVRYATLEPVHWRGRFPAN